MPEKIPYSVADAATRVVIRTNRDAYRRVMAPGKGRSVVWGIRPSNKHCERIVTMTRENLILGDLRFVDNEDRGFTVHQYQVGKLENSIFWLNRRGELALLRWLKEKKHPEEEEEPLGGVSKLTEMFEQEKQDVLDSADTGAVPGFPDEDQS